MSVYALGNVAASGLNELRVDNLVSKDGNTTFVENVGGAMTLENTTIGSTVVFPAGPSVSGQISGGHILQVQKTILTGSISDSTAATFTDLTGLLVKITPSSSSSKILLNYNFTVGQSGGNNTKFFRIKRTISAIDNTSFSVGAASGNRTQATSASYDAAADVNGQNQHSFSFVDQPSTTNEITYQLQLMHNISPFSGNIVYIGQGGNNAAYNLSSPIVFIAMEVV